jgi:hypothetical protein
MLYGPLNPVTLVTLTFHNADANLRTTQINYEHNNSFHRRMRLWRDPLSIRGHTGCDASLSL